MDSLTRHPLDEGQIATLVGHAFGPGARLDRCVELTGGTFNAVHGVDLVDGRRLVLKVAPPSEREAFVDRLRALLDAQLARASADRGT